MTITVLAPITGTVVAMGDVPDQVFSESIVGPGVAIDPGAVDELRAIAPVTGRIVKAHAHAFVIQMDNTRAILTHLGLDTVQLKGEGFTVSITDGQDVEAKTLAVTWSPKAVIATGRSVISPIVALDGKAEDIELLAKIGSSIQAGDPLFEWK